MKISIILPLFDRRNAGWRSLESAVGQVFRRDAYEVVAVTGTGLDLDAEDVAVSALLAQCDAVVRTDLDTGDVANEIRLFQAGYERSTGDVLLFMEGHTELTENCCAVIDAYFRHHPTSTIAWAPRINHGESPLGALVAMHNLRHERRAVAQGTFSLGANSVIRRDLFERLGAFDLRYQRFSETAIFQRARCEGIGIGSIGEPLATHYNDMQVSLWRDLVLQMGEAKFCYYNALQACGEDIRRCVRHPAYLAVNRPWCARLFYPLFHAAGKLFIVLAMRSLALSKALASSLYVLAVWFTDLSGYCRACTRAAQTH